LIFSVGEKIYQTEEDVQLEHNDNYNEIDLCLVDWSCTDCDKPFRGPFHGFFQPSVRNTAVWAGHKMSRVWACFVQCIVYAYNCCPFFYRATRAAQRGMCSRQALSRLLSVAQETTEPPSKQSLVVA